MWFFPSTTLRTIWQNIFCIKIDLLATILLMNIFLFLMLIIHEALKDLGLVSLKKSKFFPLSLLLNSLIQGVWVWNIKENFSDSSHNALSVTHSLRVKLSYIQVGCVSWLYIIDWIVYFNEILMLFNFTLFSLGKGVT